MGPEHDG
jgi:hypothetical protein